MMGGALGIVLALLAPVPASAWTFSLLHEFQGVGDGEFPIAGVTFDQDGNLYGTASQGGDPTSCGTVFKIGRRPAGGFRDLQVLHRFNRDNGRGCTPEGGVVAAAGGALYGTTLRTTSTDVCNCGVVFSLAPSDGRAWKKAILHNFLGSPNDGILPSSDLLLHPDGAIYGVTHNVGQFGNGTLFKIKISARGVAREVVLHNFRPHTGTAPSSGAGPFPYGSLAVDADGALYGTTNGGGDKRCGCGVIFKLTPQNAQHTVWDYAVLYRFKHTNETTLTSVTIGPDGALYGVSPAGGAGGSVFRLAPPAAGQTGWTKKVLYKFGVTDPLHDGLGPTGPVTFGPDGALYGTTIGGGDQSAGTVFKLRHVGNVWRETLLHVFTGGGGNHDGYYPTGALVFGPDGALYGTTQFGGTANAGTVFRLER
jgi:uncharacterized repeat protein (TIGR03803 family)